MFPNSAPDSLTPKNWKVFTLFFKPVDGAATARTAVLAMTRRLLKCIIGNGAGGTSCRWERRGTKLQMKNYRPRRTLEDKLGPY